MAKSKLKLFLMPFEWQPGYGTEIRALKAHTHHGALREVSKLPSNPLGPLVPAGRAVMAEAELHVLLRSLQDALGLWASVHWTVDDIMHHKNISRDEAIEWLEQNCKYLEGASISCGCLTLDEL